MPCACAPASLLCRLAVILSYDCTVSDSLINYALVLLTSFGGASLLWSALLFWSAATAYFWAFQIGLCLALMASDECTGISIVWSAQVGALCWLRSRQALPSSAAAERVLACCVCTAVAAWSYYAVVAPPITTVAHALAALMGAGVAILFGPARTKPLAHEPQARLMS